jgi:hypothetical protein
MPHAEVSSPKNYPVAVFMEPEPFPTDEDRSLPLLDCPICKSGQEWRLIETGYTLNHFVQRIEFDDDEQKTVLIAHGGSDFGEEGDHYYIECRNCYRWFELPDSMEVDWE